MEYQSNVSLAPLTTLRVGGPADFFVHARNIHELEEVISYAKDKSLPFFILGGGSNVLVPDVGIRGITVKNELKGISYENDENDVLVSAGAGESWDALVKQVISRNLYGIENLSGIPGTVGATPIQNVGAYGVEVSDVIEWVEVFDTKENLIKKLSLPECNFTYRDSIFKGKGGKFYIVTRVCFRLSMHGVPSLSYKDLREHFAKHNKAPEPSEVRDAVLSIRATKFPDMAEVGTAGSFFKNPIIDKEKASALQAMYPDLPCYKMRDGYVKVSLAWILDHVCSFKGLREGNVGLFANQPLILVSYSGATEKEIKMFAEKIVKTVFKKTNVTISFEVTCVK